MFHPATQETIRWSLLIEAIGQAILWRASHEWVALGGALVTGLGRALVFPALGVEALKRVLPANRGSGGRPGGRPVRLRQGLFAGYRQCAARRGFCYR
jgi:hypothetical protein